MNDSALPAATWPTSKVPPLLCSSATSKVTARQKKVAGWWISNVEGEGEQIREQKRIKNTHSFSVVLRVFYAAFTSWQRDRLVYSLFSVGKKLKNSQHKAFLSRFSHICLCSCLFFGEKDKKNIFFLLWSHCSTTQVCCRIIHSGNI